MIAAPLLYIDLVERGLTLRVDDENDRLIVSPGHLLCDADRSAIRLRKVELMAMAVIDAVEGVGVGGDRPQTEARPCNGPNHATPSRCLGPTACAVLDVCGREACVTCDESGMFAAAMATARRPGNPHGVPNFYAPQRQEAAA